MQLILKLKRNFLSRLAYLLFKLFGWKITGKSSGLKKEILIAAPHTSNWDYVVMIGAAWYFKMKISWIGKKELFSFRPLGWFFRQTGGIAVDRSRSNNMVEKLSEVIKSMDEIHLCIPPEGTRKKRDGWKSGFYHIARLSHIPITCSYIDYSTKTTGIGFSFRPEGNIEKEMEMVKEFFKNVKGKYPQEQSPVKLRTVDKDKGSGRPQLSSHGIRP